MVAAMPDNPRVYGLGDSTQHIMSVPRVKGHVRPHGGCPNCECADLYEIEVDVDHPQLVGRKGIGVFFGCPSCQFASPMMMVSRLAPKGVPADPPSPHNIVHKKEEES